MSNETVNRLSREQRGRIEVGGFPVVDALFKKAGSKARGLYEMAPDPMDIVGGINAMIAGTGSEYLTGQQIKALTIGIPQQEAQFLVDTFREGTEEAIEIAKKLLSGSRFSWWNIEDYKKITDDLKACISAGQFVTVLGDNSLVREGNKGPLMVAADYGTFAPGEAPYFIDALTNATVTNFGGFPVQVAYANAINRLEVGTQCPPYTPTALMDKASEALIDIMPIEKEDAKVAFFNAGGDSVSVAMKAAEKFVDKIRGKNGHERKVVFFREAYHGNIESGAGRATSGIRNAFHESTQSSIELEFPNLKSEVSPVLERIREEIKADIVSSILFEPTQGDGGGVSMHQDFFNQVVQLSLDEHIPLICDEVQSGFGRTGKIFDVEYLVDGWKEYRNSQGSEFMAKYPENPPMIMAVAKSITNGAVPGSAVVFPKEYAVLSRAEGLNTYSAHPATLAAIIATTEMMTPELLTMVKGKRDIFEAELAPFVDNNWIGNIRGHGMHIFIPIQGQALVQKDGKPVTNNQVLQAELLGKYRIMTGTVARDGLRVHLPLNTPDEVIKAVAQSIGLAVADLKQGIVSKETKKILSSSVSGLASRGN